jgi:hypothetical protein
MKITRILGVFIGLFLAVSPCFYGDSRVFAAENQQSYFTSIPDIPLMEGMDEVEDQSFVFDKAEGRVVGAVGFLPEASKQDPQKFYFETLGQLGWRPIKSGVFARNNEQLIVNVEKVSGGVLVKFQLVPLSR